MAVFSSADIYQHIIAAGKREHNLSYVVSEESVVSLVCNTTPSGNVCHSHRSSLLRGSHGGSRSFSVTLSIFGVQCPVTHYGYHTEREREKAIRKCEQPQKHMMEPIKHKIEHLYRLLTLPSEVYKKIIKGSLKDEPLEKQVQYCKKVFLEEMGVHLNFFSRHTAPPAV